MAKKVNMDAIFLVAILVILVGLFIYVNTLPAEEEEEETEPAEIEIASAAFYMDNVDECVKEIPVSSFTAAPSVNPDDAYVE